MGTSPSSPPHQWAQNGPDCTSLQEQPQLQQQLLQRPSRQPSEEEAAQMVLLEAPSTGQRVVTDWEGHGKKSSSSTQDKCTGTSGEESISLSECQDLSQTSCI